MENEEGAKVLQELFSKLGAGNGMAKSMKNMMGMIKSCLLYTSSREPAPRINS